MSLNGLSVSHIIDIASGQHASGAGSGASAATADITPFWSGLSCPEAARAEAPPASSAPTG